MKIKANDGGTMAWKRLRWLGFAAIAHMNNSSQTEVAAVRCPIIHTTAAMMTTSVWLPSFVCTMAVCVCQQCSVYVTLGNFLPSVSYVVKLPNSYLDQTEVAIICMASACTTAVYYRSHRLPSCASFSMLAIFLHKWNHRWNKQKSHISFKKNLSNIL